MAAQDLSVANSGRPDELKMRIESCYLPLATRLFQDLILHLLVLVSDVLEVRHRQLLDGSYSEQIKKVNTWTQIGLARLSFSCHRGTH